MIFELVQAMVFWLNSVPPSEGIAPNMSPRTIMTGYKLDGCKHGCLSFGTYVQTHEKTDSTLKARTTGAIALRPSGNAQGGYYFLSLSTGRRIAWYRWTVLPMPNEAIEALQRLAGGDRQPNFFEDDNDLAPDVDNHPEATGVDSNHEDDQPIVVHDPNEEFHECISEHDQESLDGDLEDPEGAENNSENEELDSENYDEDENAGVNFDQVDIGEQPDDESYDNDENAGVDFDQQVDVDDNESDDENNDEINKDIGNAGVIQERNGSDSSRDSSLGNEDAGMPLIVEVEHMDDRYGEGRREGLLLSPSFW